MTYGGTNWGWLGEPENYTSYDYGAAIRETRQLDPKYYEDKLIGYFTQAVAPLTKTDPINATPPDNPAIVDTARINPDTGTQFHVLRHTDSTSTRRSTATHICDRLQRPADPEHELHLRRRRPGRLQYTGTWSHVANQSYTGGDYKNTESFSNRPATRSPSLHRTAVRWIGSQDEQPRRSRTSTSTASSRPPSTARASQNQAVLFSKTGLTNGPHTLKIVVDGTHYAGSTGQLRLDRRNRPPDRRNRRGPTYPVAPAAGNGDHARRARLAHHRRRTTSSATRSCSTPPQRS